MLGRWEAHLFHDAARTFERGNCIAYCALNARLHAGDEVLLRQSESLATNSSRRSIATREVQESGVKRAA